MTDLDNMAALIRDASETSERAATELAINLSSLSGVPIVVDNTLSGFNFRVHVSAAMFSRMNKDFQP